MVLPFYFAHHPLCSNYRKEVIKIRSWYFCRGCFFVYLSTIIAFSATLIFNPFESFTIFEGISIVIIITFPAWLALFLSTQNRRLKDVFRISLGSGWGISIAESLLRPNILDKFIILACIALAYFIFKLLKTRQNLRQKDLICSKCPENKNNYCSGYKRQLEIERDFSKEISDYLQQNLDLTDIKQH
ncbi:MAG: hypothetical protein ACTSW1_11595 [Candidatus Hodarchaeales archaeon]